MAKKTATTPRLPKVGPVNQESLDELTQRLREDPVLRRAAIKSIRSDPRAFVEKVFTVTKAQRLALRTAVPKELETAIAQTYILALNNPGVRITKTQTDGKPQVTLELSLTATAPTLKDQVKKAALKAGKNKPKDDDEPTVEGEAKIRTRC